jgi:putative Holliday junction resolvase
MSDPVSSSSSHLTTRPGHIGRVLGLDIGEKRIGVAVSDETGAIASPVGFVARGLRAEADLRALVESYEAGRLIIGLPAGLSGREGPQARETRFYAEALAEALNIAVDYWDERLTTAIAERSLIASGVRRDQRRQQIDAVAAAVMLQSYLDAQRHRRRRDELL